MASFRTEKFGDEKFCISTKESVDCIDYCRELAKQRNAEGSFVAIGVLNLDATVELVKKWKTNMPRVHPFYAVKCNYEKALVRAYALLGCGFDCASAGEIELVTSMNIIDPATRIIFASSVKVPSHIKYARQAGVQMTTFDTEEELHKIADAYGPDAKLVLRFVVRNSTARFDFAQKFGAESLKQAPRLLRLARDLKLNIHGVSFHVGSGNPSLSNFETAIADARRLFDEAESLGFKPKLLDLGGGFPGYEFEGESTFEDISNVINAALDKHFPPSSDVEIIAEPGRYFAAATLTLGAAVFGVKRVPETQILEESLSIEQLQIDEQKKKAKSGFHYYIGEGVFHSLGGIACRGYLLTPKLLLTAKFHNDDSPKYTSKIWGHSLDVFDLVTELIQLPKLEIEDWIFFPTVGAYSLVTSSDFNLLPRPRLHRIMGASTWQILTEAEANITAENNNLAIYAL